MLMAGKKGDAWNRERARVENDDRKSKKERRWKRKGPGKYGGTLLTASELLHPDSLLREKKVKK